MKNYTDEQPTYSVQHFVTMYRTFIVSATSIEEAEKEAAEQLTKYIDEYLTKPFNMEAANMFTDHRDMWEHFETTEEWGKGAPMAPRDHKDTVSDFTEENEDHRVKPNE